MRSCCWGGGGGGSCASVTHDSCLRHRPCSFHLLRPRRRVSMTSCPSREENMTGRDFYIMSTHGKYWQGGERKAESRSWCLKSTDGSTNAYLLLQSAKQTKKSSTIFKGSIMTGPWGLFRGLNMKIIWWAVLKNWTWWQNALNCCLIYTIIITWCRPNYLPDSTCILNHASWWQGSYENSNIFPHKLHVALLMSLKQLNAWNHLATPVSTIIFFVYYNPYIFWFAWDKPKSNRLFLF